MVNRHNNAVINVVLTKMMNKISYTRVHSKLKKKTNKKIIQVKSQPSRISCREIIESHGDQSQRRPAGRKKHNKISAGPTDLHRANSTFSIRSCTVRPCAPRLFTELHTLSVYRSVHTAMSIYRSAHTVCLPKCTHCLFTEVYTLSVCRSVHTVMSLYRSAHAVCLLKCTHCLFTELCKLFTEKRKLFTEVYKLFTEVCQLSLPKCTRCAVVVSAVFLGV